jgi:RHS repeat-associated protein
MKKSNFFGWLAQLGFAMRLGPLRALALAGIALSGFLACSDSKTDQSEAVATTQNALTGGTDPVARYFFNEASGTVASDSSGNGHAATLQNGASFIAGARGNAVRIAGGTQRVALPANVVQACNDLTIAARVRLTTNSANWARIFDVGSSTTSYMFLTPRAGASNILRFAITTGGGAAEQQLSHTFTFPTNTWKHVAVVLNGNTGTMYVDGVQVAQNANITLNPSALNATVNNWLGDSQFAADPTLDGTVDDVLVSCRPYSASEVSWLANGTDPQAQYSFNEPSGTTAADSSGNARHATLANGASFVSGLHGNAVQIAGGSQRVNLPTSIVQACNDLTIAAHVRLATNATNWARIFDFGASTSSYMFLTPRAGAANVLRFAITTGGGAAEQRLSHTLSFPTNTWKHVAVVLSGNTGTMYLDGVQVAQNTNLTLNPSQLGATANNWLGDSQFTTDPTLNGTVDNFFVSCRPFSAAEIGALAGACTTNAQCNDGNACTTDTCNSGFCSRSAVANGTACPDGTVCNGDETCNSGFCNAGTPPVVDDGNACTTDACDPVQGVTHTPISGCGGGGAGGAGGSGGASGSGATSGSGGSSGGGGVTCPSGTTPVEMFIELPPGTSRANIALGSYGSPLDIHDRVRVLAPGGTTFASVSSLTSIATNPTRLGVESQVHHFFAEPRLELRDRSHIHGNAVSPGSVTLFPDAVVDGQTLQQPLTPRRRESWIVCHPNTHQGNIDVQPGQVFPTGGTRLAPGAWGTVAVKSTARLRLRGAATYYFESLVVEPGGIVDLDTAAGGIQLYFRNGALFRGVQERTDNRANVLFGSEIGNFTINGSFRGFVVAPRGVVDLPTVSGGVHRGSFYGGLVVAHQDMPITHETLDTTSMCAPDACNGICPCDRGKTCDDDGDCSGGLTCWRNAGRHFDLRADAGVCADPHCAINFVEAGCGDLSSTCGRCPAPPRPCSSDSHCVSGEVCGTDNGVAFDLSGTADFCWPTVCEKPAITTAYCSTPDSPCGRCDCSANCLGRTCGDEPSDGCGSICEAICDNGEPGCKSDLECPVGSVCAVGAGPLFGHPTGTNVCMYAVCKRTDPEQPNCGTSGTQCGTCPPRDPGSVCAGKECSDDGLCGTCGATEDCNPQGVCVTSVKDVPIGLPPPLPEGTTSPVGAAPGAFTVTDRGQASFSIPIEVPPGRLGVQPALNLSYLSSKRDGMLGPGWRLDGLSVIARCPKIVALEGHAAPVTYTAEDSFCMDGKRLVQVAPAEYRTEVESFKRIKAIGPFENGEGQYIGPKSFMVEEPNGRVLTYGASRTASVYAAGVKRIWALEKIQDRSNNSMGIIYRAHESRINVNLPTFGGFSGGFGDFGVDFETHDSGVVFDTGELVPEKIYYGGSDTDVLPLFHDRWVSFEYEERSDPREQFSSGAVGYTTQRLVAIETHVGERTVRRYELDFPTGRPPFNEPVLEAIRECAITANGNKVCKGATHFDYHDEVGFEAEQSFDIPFNEVLDSVDAYLVLDANGDGRDDFLRADHQAYGIHGHLTMLLSVPGALPPRYQIATAPPCMFGEFAPPGKAFVIDIDRDGRDEFQCFQGGSMWRYLGAAWQEISNPLPVPSGLRVITTKAGDVNGDGLRDIVHCLAGPANPTIPPPGRSFSLWVQLARQDGTFDPDILTGGTQTCDGWLTGAPTDLPIFDYDGDGADDLLSRTTDLVAVGRAVAKHVFVPGSPSLGLIRSSVSNEVADALIPRAGGVGFRVIDANADGLKDIVTRGNRHRDGSINMIMALNTGRGFQRRLVSVDGVVAESEATLPLPTESSDRVVDLDGDGRDDILSAFGPFHAAFRSGPRDGFQRAYLNGADPSLGAPVPAPLGAMSSNAENIVADVDGDGSRDVVAIRRAGNTNTAMRFVYQLSNAGKSHLLKRIEDGLGKVIEIDYDDDHPATEGVVVPGYDRGSCTSSTNSSAPGYDCLKKMPNLVTAHRVLDGNTMPEPTVRDQFFYRYEGARLGLGGRGPYGFIRRHIEHITGSGFLIAHTQIDFHNDSFELAGNPKLMTVEYPSVPGHAVAGPAGPFGQFDRVVTTSYDWELVPARRPSGAPPGKFPVLRRTVSQELDGDQPIVTVERTLATVSDWGNIELETTETIVHRLPGGGPGSGTAREVGRTVVDTRFDVREADWLLRLPLIRSVENEREGDEQMRTTKFGHDERGLLETIEREPAQPEFYLKTTLDRNDRGNVFATRQQGQAGPERKEEVGFELHQIFPVSMTNAKGQVTKLHFDQAHGELLTSSDPNGLVTQRAYDAFGRARRVLTPVDDVQAFYAGGQSSDTPVGPYAANLSVTTLVVDGGMTTEFVDAFGRVRQVIGQGFEGTFVAQDYAYDWAGRVTRESAPHLLDDLTSQGVTHFDYDAIGRLVRERYPDGSMTDYVHGVPLGTRALTEVPHASAVSLVATVHPKGNFTLTQFDYEGDVVMVTEGPSLESINNPPPGLGDVAFTRYAYGAFGSLLSVTDAEGSVTTIVPDAIGRRAQMSNPGTSTGAMTYEYTPFDEVEFYTDGRGRRDKYEYDPLSRLTKVLDGGEVVAEYVYDGEGDPDAANAIGRLSSMWRRRSPESTDGTQVRYEYEPGSKGRLAKIHREIAGETNALITTLNYDPDKPSRIGSISYPSAGGQDFQTFHEYDGVGNLRALRSDTGEFYWQLREADQGIRLKREEFGNGVQSTRDYYRLGMTAAECQTSTPESCMPGRLRTIQTSRPDGSGTAEIQDRGYRYDRNGNISSRIATLPDDVVTGDTFFYDQFDRMTARRRVGLAVNDPEEEFDLRYDRVGNITRKTRISFSAPPSDSFYTYHASHRDRVIAAGTASYDYDGNGNQVHRDDPLPGIVSQTLDYDDLSVPWRIATTRSSGTVTTELEYDANGTRIAKRSQIETTLYAGDLYERTTRAGSVDHRYRVYAGGREVVNVIKTEQSGTITSTSTQYLHDELQGSVELVTGLDAETLEERGRFKPFGGAPTTLASGTGVKTGYTGHQHDPELGLVNMRGRLYDPELQRFTAADPFVTEPFSGQGLNRYAYVKNNPMTFVDPSGFDDEAKKPPPAAPKPPPWAFTGDNQQHRAFNWLNWQHRLAQEMGLEKAAPAPAAPAPGDAGDSKAEGEDVPDSGAPGSGDPGARVTGGNGTPRSYGNSEGVTGGPPPSPYLSGHNQGQGGGGRSDGPGSGGGSGNSTPGWVAARAAGGFLPFVGSVLTMQDPNATDSEKGEALVELLVDAGTLGAAAPLKGVLKLGKRAKSAGRGAGGGARPPAHQQVVEDRLSRRAEHRENRSRDSAGRARSGEGHRDTESATRGPAGERPRGDTSRNRERNVGIDEEHSMKPKGSGVLGSRRQ